MNFHSILLLAGRTLAHRSNTLNLSRVVYGIKVCALPHRSLHLSQNDKGVASGQLSAYDDGIFKKAYRKIKFFMFDNAKLSATGYYLYEVIADRIDYLKFFEEMSIPDTLNSWFLVTELHVWMLMAKAMEFQDGGRVIRNKIVEAMWSDVNNKASKLGPENIARAREQLQELGDQFQAAILAYDEGILSDDKVLASALWRRFFEKECKDVRSLEIMVRYVRQQMEYLDSLSEDDFKKRKIVWIPFDKI